MCEISEAEMTRALRSWRGLRWFVDETCSGVLWRAQQHCKTLSGYPSSAFEAALARRGITPKFVGGFWEIQICEHKEAAR